jgi:hypothetical protein
MSPESSLMNSMGRAGKLLRSFKNLFLKKVRRIIFFYLSFLIFLSPLVIGEALSQPFSKGESLSQIRLGNITFHLRKIESTPSPLSFLDVQVEVFNRSQKITAPPNSIRVVVSLKEVKYSNSMASEEYSPPSQEATLYSPLSPGSGRVLIIGFLMPKERVNWMTFEIQINPPEGEKKIFTANLKSF